VHGSLDYETASVHQVTIRSTDRGGAEIVRTLPIIVRNANDAPTDILLNEVPVRENGIITVPENSVSGYMLARLRALDPDVGQTHSFSLVPGSGGGVFAVAGDRLVVLTADIDYEARAAYSLLLVATDNGQPAKSLTLPITVKVRILPTVVLWDGYRCCWALRGCWLPALHGGVLPACMLNHPAESTLLPTFTLPTRPLLRSWRCLCISALHPITACRCLMSTKHPPGCR